jgi:hypothetical protein
MSLWALRRRTALHVNNLSQNVTSRGLSPKPQIYLEICPAIFIIISGQGIFGSRNIKDNFSYFFRLAGLMELKRG